MVGRPPELLAPVCKSVVAGKQLSCYSQLLLVHTHTTLGPGHIYCVVHSRHTGYHKGAWGALLGCRPTKRNHAPLQVRCAQQRRVHQQVVEQEVTHMRPFAMFWSNLTIRFIGTHPSTCQRLQGALSAELAQGMVTSTPREAAHTLGSSAHTWQAPAAGGRVRHRNASSQKTLINFSLCNSKSHYRVGFSLPHSQKNAPLAFDLSGALGTCYSNVSLKALLLQSYAAV